MDLVEVIVDRRAVRNFEATSIEEPIIHTLLNAAMAAPNAMNRQPWAFSVCLNRKRVDELANRAKTWLLENPEQAPTKLLIHHMASKPEFAIFHHPQCGTWYVSNRPRTAMARSLSNKA